MKFSAEVIHQAARPNEEDRFCTVPLIGDSALSIANRVAEQAARRRFGDKGETGFALRINANTFCACIGSPAIVEGQYKLDGVTIKITLLADDEAARAELENYEPDWD